MLVNIVLSIRLFISSVKKFSIDLLTCKQSAKTAKLSEERRSNIKIKKKEIKKFPLKEQIKEFKNVLFKIWRFWQPKSRGKFLIPLLF